MLKTLAKASVGPTTVKLVDDEGFVGGAKFTVELWFGRTQGDYWVFKSLRQAYKKFQEELTLELNEEGLL